MSTHIETSSISYEAAARIVAAAIEQGAAAGVAVVVTVVDPALGLVAFGRSDHATPHSVETSRRKAATAASTRRASTAMNPDLAVALEHGTGGILTSIAGGVPIRFDGRHLGGLGVAGGPPHIDAEIALATLAAVGADDDFDR